MQEVSQRLERSAAIANDHSSALSAQAERLANLEQQLRERELERERLTTELATLHEREQQRATSTEAETRALVHAQEQLTDNLKAEILRATELLAQSEASRVEATERLAAVQPVLDATRAQLNQALESNQRQELMWRSKLEERENELAIATAQRTEKEMDLSQAIEKASELERQLSNARAELQEQQTLVATLNQQCTLQQELLVNSQQQSEAAVASALATQQQADELIAARQAMLETAETERDRAQLALAELQATHATMVEELRNELRALSDKHDLEKKQLVSAIQSNKDTAVLEVRLPFAPSKVR